MELIYEIAIGVLAIAFEAVAISVTFSARRRMSNPSLLKCMRSVILATAGLTAFSVWHTAREASLISGFSGLAPDFPEHIFVLLAAALFLHAAWTLQRMSRVYGFREQAKKMALRTEGKGD